MECVNCHAIVLENEWLNRCPVCTQWFCNTCSQNHIHPPESKEVVEDNPVCRICEERSLVEHLGRICSVCKNAVCDGCMYHVVDRCPFCRAPDFGPPHSPDLKEDPQDSTMCLICDERDLVDDYGITCRSCNQAVCNVCMYHVIDRCPFCRAPNLGFPPRSIPRNDGDNLDDYTPTSPTYDHEQELAAAAEDDSNHPTIDLTESDEEEGA